MTVKCKFCAYVCSSWHTLAVHALTAHPLQYIQIQNWINSTTPTEKTELIQEWDKKLLDFDS